MGQTTVSISTGACRISEPSAVATGYKGPSHGLGVAVAQRVICLEDPIE